MRGLSLAAAVALMVSLLAPAATAYVQPVFYFLKSGCSVEEVQGECPVPEVSPPTVPPLPPPLPPAPAVGQPKFVLADGVLDPYTPYDPNFPNSTEPDLKPVYPLADAAIPIQFVTPANHTHPDRIKGSFVVGLWTGESVALAANLTATLYEIPAEGTPIALANASVRLDLNASEAPDPTALMPPNSTDPQVIAYYELAQLLPLVMSPPIVFLLGPVDVTFANTSRFGIGFHIAQGSSPLPSGLGSATIQFNGSLSPSFLYVPWYAPDPPRPTYSRSSTFSRASSTRTGAFGAGGGGAGGDDDDPGGKKGNGIPGLELPLVLALVAVAAWSARRRLD